MRAADVLLVGIYLGCSTAMPLFNYFSMTEAYEYPINSTAIQFLCTALICGSINFILNSKHKTTTSPFRRDHLVPKLFHLALPAFLFSLDISLNNSSLTMTSVTVHILLKTTGVVWSLFLAWSIQRERPPRYAVACAAAMAFGGGIIALGVLADVGAESAESVIGIVMTVSASILGCVYSTLVKRGLTILRAVEAIDMHPTESTFLVMGLVALLMLAYAAAVEPGCWAALVAARWRTWLVLAGGVALSTGMKLSNMWLLTRKALTSTGVIAEFKVIPQILLDSLLFGKYAYNWELALGSAAIVGASLAYACLRFLAQRARGAKLGRALR